MTIDAQEHDALEAMKHLTAALKAPQVVNQPLLLALIKSLDEKIGLLVGAQKEGVTTAMAAAEKAVTTAMTAAEKANDKAEKAAEKRFEGLNELRGMAADWRSEFARQASVDLQFKTLEDRVVAQTKQIDGMTNRHSGRSDVVVWAVGGLAAGASIALILNFVLHVGH